MANPNAGGQVIQAPVDATHVAQFVQLIQLVAVPTVALKVLIGQVVQVFVPKKVPIGQVIQLPFAALQVAQAVQVEQVVLPGRLKVLAAQA